MVNPFKSYQAFAPFWYRLLICFLVTEVFQIEGNFINMMVMMVCGLTSLSGRNPEQKLFRQYVPDDICQRKTGDTECGDRGPDTAVAFHSDCLCGMERAAPVVGGKGDGACGRTDAGHSVVLFCFYGRHCLQQIFRKYMGECVGCTGRVQRMYLRIYVTIEDSRCACCGYRVGVIICAGQCVGSKACHEVCEGGVL